MNYPETIPPAPQKRIPTRKLWLPSHRRSRASLRLPPKTTRCRSDSSKSVPEMMCKATTSPTTAQTTHLKVPTSPTPQKWGAPHGNDGFDRFHTGRGEKRPRSRLLRGAAAGRGAEAAADGNSTRGPWGAMMLWMDKIHLAPL